MKKPTLSGVLLGAALATAGFLAGYGMMRDPPAPFVAAAKNCTQEELVSYPADPTEEQTLAESIVEAIVGDASGNGADEPDIATEAGAVAGNQIQEDIQETKADITIRTRCFPFES